MQSDVHEPLTFLSSMLRQSQLQFEVCASSLHIRPVLANTQQPQDILRVSHLNLIRHVNDCGLAVMFCRIVNWTTAIVGNQLIALLPLAIAAKYKPVSAAGYNQATTQVVTCLLIAGRPRVDNKCAC